jgi:hypothetical protein
MNACINNFILTLDGAAGVSSWQNVSPPFYLSIHHNKTHKTALKITQKHAGSTEASLMHIYTLKCVNAS